MIDHIRIVEITNDDRKCAQTIYASSDEWREGLTRDQHCARECALENKLLSHGMPTRRWAVERFNLEVNDWEIVSSMEAVERPAVLKLKGEAPMSTRSYVFDAVYTPKECRGRGYASLMITKVVDELTSSICNGVTDAEPRALAKSLITLWSDVGDYYSRFGFKRAPTVGLIESLAQENSQVEWPKDCMPLDMVQSQAAIDYHRAMMVGAIDVMTEKDGKPRAVVAPTAGILDQMQWRSGFVSQCVGGTNPVIYGARTPNGWTAWGYNIMEKKLNILAISGPIHEMVHLFQAALAAAIEVGNFDVVLYEADLIYPDGSLAQYLLDSLKSNGVNFVRSLPDHSIPYYLASGDRADLQWEFAGKYSWF